MSGCVGCGLGLRDWLDCYILGLGSGIILCFLMRCLGVL